MLDKLADRVFLQKENGQPFFMGEGLMPDKSRT